MALRQSLLAIFLLALSFICWSNTELQTNLVNHPRVDSIEIRGLSRTEEIVIRRELLFAEGDKLTTKALLESIQQIKNLRIFSYVRPYLQLKADNKVKLIIELSEKWSTIPFASYSQGGGTEYFYFGVYDINTLGKYIETGFQYDNWNGEHGGLVWFRNPRFLNKKLSIGADIWATQKPIYLYNTAGEDQGNFILRQELYNFFIKKQFTKSMELGIRTEYSKDSYHTIKLTNRIDQNTANILHTLDDTTTLLNTLTLKIGKLNYDIDVIQGTTTELLLSHSSTKLLSDSSFSKMKWVTQTYWSLPKRSYIASNLTVAATNTNLLHEYYYVGGFEHIRGYLTGQFRNRSYWQLNTEYRIPSYQSSWIILQHIFFVDVANSANKIYKLKDFEKNIYSAGIGFRLISPKIYSFNGRLDFALFTSEESQISLSFGTQHFF